MAMKAKMAADKEKVKAEKRHQEVCVCSGNFNENRFIRVSQ